MDLVGNALCEYCTNCTLHYEAVRLHEQCSRIAAAAASSWFGITCIVRVVLNQLLFPYELEDNITVIGC